MKYEFNNYPNETFIETGRGHGIGLLKAVKTGCFKQLYSIENKKDLFDECNRKFIFYKNVKLFYGSSINILPGLLKNINHSCTFWLDAHLSRYCPVPLIEELRIIGEHQIKTHIILIDDMRLVGKQHYWKELSIGQIESEILKINPDYKISYDYGVANNGILIARL
jgi:hypothetical protein